MALKSPQGGKILLSSVGVGVASMAASLIWGVSDTRREGDSTCSGVSGARGQYKRMFKKRFGVNWVLYTL